MADTDPVLIRITIDYKSSDEAIETGYTVAEWNALSDAERQQVARDMWGGMTVETKGAESV